MIKHNYKELKIWQKARSLNKRMFLLSESFDSKYNYTLSYQMTKSSLSVMSNIAEGSAMGINANFIRFLGIAMGSLCELESQLIASQDLDLVDFPTYECLANEIEELKKMITGFEKSIINKTNQIIQINYGRKSENLFSDYLSS